MMELLGNAWAGWENFITQGKLAALLAVVLLYIWFYKRGGSKKGLVLYTTIAFVCCVFPVTAGMLMTYQTKFYDYEWIWSIIPLTVVIAFGLTCFFVDLYQEKNVPKKTMGAVVVMCVAVILLCGSMGVKKDDGESAYLRVLYPYGPVEEELRRQAYETIGRLNEIAGGEELVLWAPIEIMEYAREADAGIRLPYGRNLWDISLNGYSYDTYEPVIYDMYLWMEMQNATCDEEYLLMLTGAEEAPSAEKCIQKALELGVNCVLLPAETYSDTIQMIEEALGAKAQQIEEYWVIYE